VHECNPSHNCSKYRKPVYQRVDAGSSGPGKDMTGRVATPEGSQGESDTGIDVFVARQPIFSRNLQVYGYELLYCGGPGNSF
jgi:hypothetical protein